MSDRDAAGGQPGGTPKINLSKNPPLDVPKLSEEQAPVPPPILTPPPAAPAIQPPPGAVARAGATPGGRPIRKPSRTTLISVGGLLAVVLLAGGGFLLGKGGDSTAPTENGVTASSPRQEESGTAGDSGQEIAGPDESADTGSDVAVEIYSLIQESSRDKANIQAAARELTSCGDLDGAARTFDAAEASRNTLAERASALDLSTLPEAGPLVAQLTQAWSYSAQADAAFADAARYSPCDNSSSELASATELSTKSHPHKDEAARLWNELANGRGLPTIVGAQL